MYTIKEAANMLNISTVAVYKRINRPNFSKYVVIKDEIKYITQEGFRKLEETSNIRSKPKEEIEIKNIKVNDSGIDIDIEKPVSEDIVVLELVNILKQQLETKDKQIDAVTQLFKETKSELIRLNEQLNATQGELTSLLQLREKGNIMMEANRMDRKMLDDSTNQDKKQGIFSKLFSKNKI